MAEPAHHLPQVLTAAHLPRPFADTTPAWHLPELAGRLVELTGDHGASAALTAAFALILDAQRRDAPAAWITTPATVFFPPDAAAGGVDLERLPVVRVPDGRAVARAADRLLRSGGFALVVCDLAGPDTAPAAAALPLPLQARLLGLVQKHAAAAVVLMPASERSRPGHGGGYGSSSRGDRQPTAYRLQPALAPTPALGSLTSLRVVARRVRLGPDRFGCELLAAKDKRRPPGWTWHETCHGPAGLH